MKKITVVDGNKLIKYIDGGTGMYSADELLRVINSGQNRYDKDEVFNYILSLIERKLNYKTRISNNKLGKYLYALIAIIDSHTQDSELVDESILDKMDDFKRYYINNRNGTGAMGDYSTMNIFDLVKEAVVNNNKTITESESIKVEEEKTIEEKIEELSKQEPTVTEEELSDPSRDAENLIAKLNARINDLEQDLYDQKTAFEELADKSLKSQKDYNELNRKIEETKSKLKDARKSTKEVQAKYEQYQKDTEKKIKNLEMFKELALQRETELLDLQQKINELEEEKDQLFEELKSNKSKINEQNDFLLNKKTEMKVTDNLILGLLFEKKLSIDEIIKELNEKSFNISRQEVLESLKRINETINVMPLVGLDKKYGVTAPSVRIDQRLSVPNNFKELDIMFLADFHFFGYPDEIQAKLNNVYDYCANNNIKEIITLGDIFDNKTITTESSKKAYDEARSLIDSFNKILPHDGNINNLLLGGNHDRFLLKYGIDPLENLAFSRDDVISLGYDNAYMIFGGADIVGLHHTGVPREDTVPDIKDSSEQTINYLKRAYENAHLNYSQQYFDLFGHFHSGRFVSNSGYGIVPSLLKDRNSNGAWHVKFFFNSDGRIDYMIIKGLIFKNRNEGIKSTVEIPYQKIRKQKNKPIE